MRYFPSFDYSAPRRPHQYIGVGGKTRWRGTTGTYGDTYVEVATRGQAGHGAGEYPVIAFGAGGVDQNRDVGMVLYGDPVGGVNGPYSSLTLYGGSLVQTHDYRTRMYMTEYADHPTEPGRTHVQFGIIDHTDVYNNPTTGITTSEAAITLAKNDNLEGYHSYVGRNYYWYDNPNAVAGVQPPFDLKMVLYGDPTNRVDMLYDCWVHGTLSKGSGSFDIEHPTVQGKRLRHSFIEGPQADLIYRGTAKLGVAPMVIDMDTEFDMTPGTWEGLNCTPWSMVSASGKVVEWEFEGSTLTITGDEGTNCMWMVIGERHDAHMKGPDCTMADGHGRVIVEYDEPEPLAKPAPHHHESDPS